jgi:hypothetical protein
MELFISPSLVTWAYCLRQPAQNGDKGPSQLNPVLESYNNVSYLSNFFSTKQDDEVCRQGQISL